MEIMQSGVMAVGEKGSMAAYPMLQATVDRRCAVRRSLLQIVAVCFPLSLGHCEFIP
ncbi:MAG: hypothetical protein M1296_01010 [Chloroflexi bacterium]|nr:hypothetical protein [Chloroflexota bacterium]